ncbi:MAG: amidohydrolase [Proteobacteria bacterium]|nr:amidohydrolase [Pseudomonadota bacterium]
MIFYDGHVHFFWTGSFEPVRPKWQSLIDRGLRGVAVIIVAYHPDDINNLLKLIPVAYHDRTGDSFFFNEGSGFDISTAKKINEDEFNIFPYLDTRFIEGQSVDLIPYRKSGFKGLKILYVPEEDKELGIIGWENYFKRSVKESEKLIINMTEQAVSFGWPVIFHADLRKYNDFVKEVLQAYPKHPVVIPHFGSSRKLISQLMDQYKNCYTDFSSLLPFMKKDSKKYVDFITTYSDRVLFGSDTVFDEPALTAEYYDFILKYVDDDNVRTNILSGNYMRIHGF